MGCCCCLGQSFGSLSISISFSLRHCCTSEEVLLFRSESIALLSPPSSVSDAPASHFTFLTTSLHPFLPSQSSPADVSSQARVLGVQSHIHNQEHPPPPPNLSPLLITHVIARLHHYACLFPLSCPGPISTSGKWCPPAQAQRQVKVTPRW